MYEQINWIISSKVQNQHFFFRIKEQKKSKEKTPK